MENKEEKNDEEEELEETNIRKMELSSSFSLTRLRFFHYLRAVNSIVIIPTLWYSYYYLIRNDADKYQSYFTKNNLKSADDNSKPMVTISNQRKLLSHATTGSLLFCVVSHIWLRLKKRSLIKLLTNIKASHKKQKKQNENEQEPEQKKNKKIMLKNTDLKLLDEWKSVLGGTKYYFGGAQLSSLMMLYVSLSSETTMFSSYKAHQKCDESDITPINDWRAPFYQFSDDKQTIEVPQHIQKQTGVHNDDSYKTQNYASSDITFHILK
eukprot:237561_1